MLVIGRKRDEKLIINGNIEITVLKVGRNHVKFGVSAPREIPIQTRSVDYETEAIVRGERTRVAAAGQASSPSEPAHRVGVQESELSPADEAFRSDPTPPSSGKRG